MLRARSRVRGGRLAPRVLIVDDDPHICEALALLLEPTYEAVTVSGGGEALARLGRERFDVVLLDLRMPGVTGGDVVRELRLRRDVTPVVLMSAHADLTGEAEELGIDRFLVKPFEIEALERMLAEVVAEG